MDAGLRRACRPASSLLGAHVEPAAGRRAFLVRACSMPARRVWCARRAGLGILLFAEQPEQHVYGAFIDVASYKHEVPDGNAADSERITGPLPEQIARALTYLRVSPLTPTVSRKDGGGRHDYPSYAERALQEAIVNAVVHRDYEVRGSQIIIRLFPDRIEFRNPGALYNTLTVENLYAGCRPVRRNQLLAGFMRDYRSAVTGGSFMEARGEGFLNLVRDSVALSGRRPELEQIGDATKLTIHAAKYVERETAPPWPSPSSRPGKR